MLSTLHSCELARDAHHNVIALPRWRALGMKSYEIESSAGLPGDIVALMRAMIEKTAQELGSFRIRGAGRIRAADASFGERAQNGVDGIVV